MEDSKDINFWQFIAEKLSAGTAVILLYVLKSKGSSPGRQGFKMTVSADDDFFGTIGGGIMEHKFVEMAKSKLKEHANDSGIYQQFHDKSGSGQQSGMICSGEQTIFLYHIQNGDIIHIKALIESLKNNLNGCLQLRKTGIFFSEIIPPVDFELTLSDEQFLLTEKTGYKNKLYIIGGGHCSLAFSKLMYGMDFYIHLIDDRHGLNTMLQNEFVHEKTIVNSYTALNTLISGGKNVYVAIMTYGYRSDDVALRALLGKHFRYLGMLGSKKKIDKMFAAYRKEMNDSRYIDNIYSPIGIQIKSQTPEEIAVSIAAEIISVKNKDQ